MTTVAVTGASGIFGRALCAVLEDDPAVDRVVGLARRPFDPHARGWDKTTFVQADVRDRPGLQAAFAGAEVVCHLAFVVTGRRRGDLAQAEAINVAGSANAFAAAARAGARRIVYASSIAAYGAHPDNPVPITEDQPLRPNAGFYYSEHKAAVEGMLDRFQDQHPDVQVVRIRPGVVVGPNSVDLFRGLLPVPAVGLLVSRWVPWLLPDPGMAEFQLVHEDDVAEVFRLAITGGQDVAGAYNLAGAGTLTAAELARALGAVRTPLRPAVVRRVADVGFTLGLLPGSGAWVDMICHPLVVDTTRARRDLGWTPRFDTRTALQDMLGHFRRASWVRF